MPLADSSAKKATVKQVRSTFSRDYFSTPKGNCVLTPRPAPTRESETFGPNRTRWRGTFRTSEGTAAKQRHLTFWVASRKQHEILGINAKTPRGTLSAFSVHSDASESSLTEFSSPGRTRTYDKAINSRLLYQLSYRGMVSQQIQTAPYRGSDSQGSI